MEIKWWKIALPVAFGLGAAVWLIVSEVDSEVFSGIDFTLRTFLFILLAFAFMCGRDLGYMIRIRLFARGDLTWKQAFRIIMLWEFTSAVTPSTVGGTAVAVVYIHKEGLNVGRSTTLVMLTAFFDEFFFALSFPLAIWFIGYDQLFAFASSGGALMTLVVAGYFVKLLLTLALSYGLFINPRGLGRFIVRVFSIRFLRRWRGDAEQTAKDLVMSSREIRRYKPMFWLKAFLATALSWTSRFMVANAIFMAFVSVSDHLMVFGRQLAMWVPMIISPTPGGAGFAEYIFNNFLGDVISDTAGMTPIIALLWRGITFYPYLIIGALIIPRWVARVRNNRIAKRRDDSTSEDSTTQN